MLDHARRILNLTGVTAMTNHLGDLFRTRRDALRWSLGEVARRLGSKNVIKACNRIVRLEREGEVEGHLLLRLATVLDLSEHAVREAIRADRVAYMRAWEKWADQPVPPTVVMRAIPGVMVGVPVPPETTTPEAVVAFAQAHAARLGKKVFLSLNRRETVGITEAGEISGRFVATPDSDPCPAMSLKRVKFLFRFGESGEGGSGGPKG